MLAILIFFFLFQIEPLKFIFSQIDWISSEGSPLEFFVYRDEDNYYLTDLKESIFLMNRDEISYGTVISKDYSLNDKLIVILHSGKNDILYFLYINNRKVVKIDSFRNCLLAGNVIKVGRSYYFTFSSGYKYWVEKIDSIDLWKSSFHLKKEKIIEIENNSIGPLGILNINDKFYGCFWLPTNKILVIQERDIIKEIDLNDLNYEKDEFMADIFVIDDYLVIGTTSLSSPHWPILVKYKFYKVEFVKDSVRLKFKFESITEKMDPFLNNFDTDRYLPRKLIYRVRYENNDCFEYDLRIDIYKIDSDMLMPWKSLTIPLPKNSKISPKNWSKYYLEDLRIIPNDITIRISGFLRLVGNELNEYLIFSGEYEIDIKESVPLLPIKVQFLFDAKENYPNSLNSANFIEFNSLESNLLDFNLRWPSKVTVKVYDVMTCTMLALIEAELNIGRYKIRVEYNELPEGIYFYKVDKDKLKRVEVKKIIIKQ